MPLTTQATQPQLFDDGQALRAQQGSVYVWCPDVAELLLMTADLMLLGRLAGQKELTGMRYALA